MSVETKIAAIRETLSRMGIGCCGVKWGLMIWRRSEDGFQVGVEGVRQDSFIHSLESATTWVAWKRGLVQNQAAQVA